MNTSLKHSDFFGSKKNRNIVLSFKCKSNESWFKTAVDDEDEVGGPHSHLQPYPYRRIVLQQSPGKWEFEFALQHIFRHDKSVNRVILIYNVTSDLW